MNAKAAIFSFSLLLVIFLSLTETTLAKPKAFHVERYARNRMFLPEHDNPEAIREFVERNIPSTKIADNVCFGTADNPDGSFTIKQTGKLEILRMDFKPPSPQITDTFMDYRIRYTLSDKNHQPVIPKRTTNTLVHFDFRFGSDNPYEVNAGDTFFISEETGSGYETCVSLWGYYSPES
ncbi:uncharacterized protein [Montipora foliosa]|uniref:uncharacterized protein n=1 Tax=Montipora foliosa TaxID=591990 RepID=UPI0035F20F2B